MLFFNYKISYYYNSDFSSKYLILSLELPNYSFKANTSFSDLVNVNYGEKLS